MSVTFTMCNFFKDGVRMSNVMTVVNNPNCILLQQLKFVSIFNS